MNSLGKPLILLLLLSLTCQGCNKCRNDDCPADAGFLFQVQDSDGQPLIGSTNFNEIIESSKIQIVGVDPKGVEQPIRLWQDGLTFRFNVSNELNYIVDYAVGANDTLNFTTDVYSDDCCSNIVTGYQVEVNSNGNLTSSLADSVFVFVK